MKLQHKQQSFGSRKNRKGERVFGTLPISKPNKFRMGSRPYRSGF